MKAVLLRGYGNVEQLDYTDVPDPKPGLGEVLVKVAAASLNPLDWKLRSGALKAMMPLPLPFILGSDAAGTVEEVGSGVTVYKKGDRVLGFVQHSYAELLVTKPENLALLPDGLSFEQAGVIPVVALTGAQVIEEGIQLKAGQRVLVTGALGAVGRVAVHVATARGGIVIAGVRARQKSEAIALGASQVIAIDDDVEIAGLMPVDAIVDTVGGGVIEKLLPKLKPNGILGSILGKPPAAEKAGIQVAQIYAHADSKRLAELAEEVRNGRLLVPIGQRFKLSDIRNAHATAEKGGAGKTLITP